MKIAKFELSLFGINTYVIWDPPTHEAAIIDPGMSNIEEEEAVSDFISREGLKLTHLINTHLHIDHAIGNRYIRQKYDLPTEASLSDAFLGERMASQAEAFGIGTLAQEVVIDKPLKEGDIIKIGEIKLEVLEVPGHSPGSLVLYDRKAGVMFAGDVLFRGSIGRSDLPGGDGSLLVRGIKEKLMTLPGSTVVYPGHGPATTIADEERSNPYLL